MSFARRIALVAVVPALIAVSSSARAAQPHMEAALASLENALAELKQATADKGGNRANAIRAVEKEIREVKKGIEYDRSHQSPGEAARKP